MANLIPSLKALIIGVLASAGLVVGSINPSPSPSSQPQSVVAPKTATYSASNKLVPSAASVPAIVNVTQAQASPQSSSTPLPLNGENYIYIRGTYSYLGQKIKYFLIVPRKGGSFSGSIEGACTAQLGAEYAGGEGGMIKGNVGGTCNLWFVKYKGSTPFTGRLYQETKTLEIEIPNSPFKGPIKLNYN